MSYQTHHQTHFPCNKGHIYRYVTMTCMVYAPGIQCTGRKHGA